MTNEDKQLICEYMGWRYRINEAHVLGTHKDFTFMFCDDGWGRHVCFDLNDAALVVQEMQNRGGKGKASAFSNFVWTAHGEWLRNNKDGSQSDFIAWLFTAKNFFKAFVEWRKKNER